MGKSKEVDEWLMGSGESAETAASKQDATQNAAQKNIGSGLIEKNPQA